MDDPVKVDTSRVNARKLSEKNNIFARLPSASAASRTQAQRILQLTSGLSIVEWRTLWDLHEAGAMTIRDLSEAQQYDHSVLSRALPQMRRKGYVTMVRDTRDGRQTIVSITPSGRAAYEQAAPSMARRRAALRDVFNAQEIETFVGYLERLEGLVRTPIENFTEGHDAAE